MHVVAKVEASSTFQGIPSSERGIRGVYEIFDRRQIGCLEAIGFVDAECIRECRPVCPDVIVCIDLCAARVR
jgi:hypothetical protein